MYRAQFEGTLGDHRLAAIHACEQQQRVPGTPRFQHEIEAMIGRGASIHTAHRPWDTNAGAQ